ncbi:hypothetical protein ASPWEDRAFT_172129 [Aspergillus wentii DTO 134E9]|uniref:histidinol-phosphate transaminase n=1 Tax=Aspergillus wentii DTO 134E9 TaxID=1073089 RepID=A0A1L9RK73_ASPWE|nr:uncharacterized protein ASPWEDRAFT_172129 [Aspergillus wentii DTO 134E9]OJJ35315.1 hypothetical protein ASPWEDRAFT_172129 [Aspergillus wentii DTO 134E9]
MEQHIWVDDYQFQFSSQCLNDYNHRISPSNSPSAQLSSTPQLRAKIYDVGVHECPLEFENDDFVLPIEGICETLTSDQSIKVVILASPGNPTGSLIPVKHIKRILNLETFHGLLVVDEAYIDFSSTPEDASTVQLLSEYANLVVVQSLS